MNTHKEPNDDCGSYRAAAQRSLYVVALLYAVGNSIAMVASDEQRHPYAAAIGNYVLTIVICGGLILLAQRVLLKGLFGGAIGLLTYLLFQVFLVVALAAGGAGYSAGTVLFTVHILYAVSVIVAWSLAIRAWIREQ